jgi:hypothetical protein
VSVIIAELVRDGKEYVLACDYTPKTNGLGKTQRAIVAFLATCPAGFDNTVTNMTDTERQALHWHGRKSDYGDDYELAWHGRPYGVKVPTIATAAYGSETPSPAQIRVVQRNVRRLQRLDLVDCWHGLAGFVDRPYVMGNKTDAVMPQAVSALWVALRWDCEHQVERARIVAEYVAEKALTASAIANLSTEEVMAALQGRPDSHHKGRRDGA